jgi:GNAT superfamily N-acetyltransferase
MRISQIITEIERISKGGYEGGKEAMQHDYGREKTVRPLPGGSGLLYSITDGGGDYEIKIWDPRVKEYNPGEPPKKLSWQMNAEYQRSLARWKERHEVYKKYFERSPGQLVGKLDVEAAEFPMKGAVQVNTITVDEDYRGRGIAKALYGIVLTIMRRPLVAGSSQTPGGRRNWASLSQIPGVQMKGYVILDEEDLETDPYDSDARWSKKAEQNIDTIMSKLGGQYIGSQPGEYYFAFDVQPASTGKELKAYVDTNLSKVYSNGYRQGSQYGLFAVWTGKI